MIQIQIFLGGGREGGRDNCVCRRVRVFFPVNLPHVTLYEFNKFEFTGEGGPDIPSGIINFMKFRTPTPSRSAHPCHFNK